MKKVKTKYQNKGGKEKAATYYKDNKEAIKGKARIKYKQFTEEKKELKRQYSRNRYNKLKQKYFILTIKSMSKQTLKFNDIAVNKKDFYTSKEAIPLNSVNTNNSHFLQS